MMRRKTERDDALDRRLPIPCQMVSNEETTPIAQTEIEARIEQTILDDASRYSRKLAFLKSVLMPSWQK